MVYIRKPYFSFLKDKKIAAVLAVEEVPRLSILVSIRYVLIASKRAIIF
jgi:hypothetical protein